MVVWRRDSYLDRQGEFAHAKATTAARRSTTPLDASTERKRSTGEKSRFAAARPAGQEPGGA
jgi:hypothetical protein